MKIEQKEKEILNRKDPELKAPKEQKKDDNLIEKDKQPFIQDKIDEFILDEMIKPENEIEKRDKFLIFGNKKQMPKNLIQHIYFDIPKAIKEPNEIISEEKKILPLIKESTNEIKLENNLIMPNNLKKSEIKHIDTILLEQKEMKPLEQEKIDELPIEGEKRPDNAIESTKRIKILKNDKPQNQIINTEKLNILAEEKKEIKPKIQFENEIKEQEGLFISSKSKEPLLINKNENIFIEPSKRLILSKRFENLVGNKENDINIEGIKNLQNPKNENENENENEIMSQEKIFIPGEKKEKIVLLPKKFEIIDEEKVNHFYLKANENKQVKEFFPVIPIRVIDNLYIPSKGKIPLLERENYINKIEPQLKIENTQSVYIEPNIHDLSDNFQKEFIHEICIGYMIKPEYDNSIAIKDTNKNMQLKGRQKKFDDISGESRE
jgi:hypothetical protein